MSARRKTQRAKITDHRGPAIVRLGGSVITQKDGSFNCEAVRMIARELKSYAGNIVVIHGGGSFTRGVFRRHGIHSDFLSSDQQPVIDEFRRAMRTLNMLVLDILKGEGLDCRPVAPHKVFACQNGEVATHDAELVGQLFVGDSTPVLFTDILVDMDKGYYACSSEQLVSYLAEILRPKVVAFVTDVDGIYESYPPASEHVKPLQVVDAALLARLDQGYTVGGSDMCGKLRQALACVPFTAFCCIINGLVQGNLATALAGQILVGTRIV